MGFSNSSMLNFFLGVLFLLTSNTLPCHASIHHDNDVVLRILSQTGKFEMMEYLLDSKELSEHANIYANGSSAMLHLCRNSQSVALFRKIILSFSPGYDFKHPENHISLYELLTTAFYSKNEPVVDFILYDLKMSFSQQQMKNIEKDYPQLPELIFKRDNFFHLNDVLVEKKSNSHKIKM